MMRGNFDSIWKDLHFIFINSWARVDVWPKWMVDMSFTNIKVFCFNDHLCHKNLTSILQIHHILKSCRISQTSNFFVLNFISFIEIDPTLVNSFIVAVSWSYISKAVEMVQAGMLIDSVDNENGKKAFLWVPNNNQMCIFWVLL